MTKTRMKSGPIPKRPPRRFHKSERQPSKTPHIKSWPPGRERGTPHCKGTPPPPRPSESPGWSEAKKDYIRPSGPGRFRRLLNLLLKKEEGLRE